MQSLNLSIQGLNTNANSLSEVKPGALLVANNLVSDKDGIIETRRGFKAVGTDGVVKADKLFNFKSTLLKAYNSKMAYDSDGAQTWQDYTGSYVKPSGAKRIYALEASRNFYFTTDGGVFKLDSVTGTPALSGMYKALDGTGALPAAGAGFFTPDNQVAYRIVWGKSDANDNLFLGSPSSRITVVNPAIGVADTVAVTFTIPVGITTSHFYQIYRSGLSGGAAIIPNDELGLVYEDNPTAGEIAAGAITITDTTPDNLRGAMLYTSPSQQGISQANDPPPLAHDLAFYKNYTYFGNTINKQRRIITLIAVSTGVGVPGIDIADTVTIGGVVYTGAAVEDHTAGEFYVEQGLTPAENIDITAQSLVRVINKYAANTAYYAYYLSGYEDLPGKILIEERTIGGSSFALISSNGAAFNPTLPVAGTSVSTTNEESPHRIYISKDRQPESVPVANYIDVGDADKKILRIIALRDSMFILKEDGVYRLTGETVGNFAVSLFDSTVALLAPESAVSFDNSIYAFTSQGIVSISDTGTAIVSRDIEADLLEISAFSNFSDITFAISYNSDNKYAIFLPTKDTDTYAKLAYVYNSLSQAWTTWELDASCGIVADSDDKIYLGWGSSGYVYQERKSYTADDYYDDELAVTIVSSVGTTVTLTSTVGVTAGYQLIQSAGVSTVESITSATEIVVADIVSWIAGAAKIAKPIDVTIETIPQTAGNPGILKQYRDITVFFYKSKFKELSIGVRSDVSKSIEYTDIVPINDGLWGGFPWGGIGWGGGTVQLQPIRTLVPRSKQRGHWINIIVKHEYSKSYFAIAGISLMYSAMSERVR